MNLVFIITDLNYGGGGERVLITLANYFQKKYRWKISIISLLKTNNKNPYNIDIDIDIYYLKDTYEQLKGNRFQRGIDKILQIKKINQNLIEIEKKMPINGVIGIGFENSWYLSLLKNKKKIKKIGTQHTSFFEFDKKNKIEKYIWQYFLKKLDKFIVLTSDAKHYFNTKLESKKVVKIPNPNPYEIKNINYSKEKIVVCIGRLSEEKQIDKLVEIWGEILLEKKYGWKLKIIGDGDCREKIKNRILELKLEKEIELIGKVSNIEEYYKKASLIVSVSKSESFSMVLIEAATFKVCPIFYDCPSGPRNIIKNNQTGFLIELNDKKEMLIKIEELLGNDDLRKKIGENSFRSLKNYEIKNVCKEWKKMLINLNNNSLDCEKESK
ncbi:MAG: glycosyltransferase [Cetobacterium sp.]|uniref:glycosyltransferase n=1 Tax=Cetobacterium sp. TaxID=2071632 RepID=UPI003F2CBC2A